MSVRHPDAADPDFASRPSHVVDTPDRYEDWRTYAFSSAPELTDNDPTPAEGTPHA